MNIFTKFFNSAKKEIRQPFLTSITQRLTGQLGVMGGKSGLHEYKNWVAGCVSARAEDVGNIDLFLKKGGEKVESHELLDLLYAVNPNMTMFELFEATQAFKDLDGNAFWYLARDGEEGKGKIKQIYPIRPDRMSIVTNKENPLIVDGYVFSAQDGTKVPFSAKEILHFKNFNPLGNHPYVHKGIGIVQSASYAIDTDNEVRKWNFNFFKNSAKPDGILYSDGGVDADEHKRLTAQWKQEHEGSENNGKIAVLSGGVKWQEITRTQKDMDFSGQRQFNMEEILALFRVPKAILGMVGDINRANADASIYVYMLRTIKPQMQKLIDTLNEFFVPEFGDDLELDFKSPVPEDRVQTVSEYTQGINKWLTRNEIRAREGLTETKEGDKIFGSFNEMPVDEATPAPAKSISNAKPAKKDASPAEKVINEFIAKMPKEKKQKGLSADAKSVFVDGWIKRIETNTNPLKKKVEKYFDAQKAEVIKNLKDELKGLEAKEYKLKGIDDMLFDEPKAISAGISLITPFLRQYIADSGKASSDLVGIDFDSATSNIATFVKERSKFFATSINETTKDKLFSAIKEGIDNSEDLESISERVAGVYDDAINYRTDMIARTEVSASSNFGAVEAYKQAGITEHEWKVVNPEDDDCIINDGAVVKIGEAFPSGDTESPIHPNCVCTTLPVFND